MAYRTRRYLAAIALLVGAPTAACSLLFATDDPCTTSADCAGKGAAFAGTQCVDHVCVGGGSLVDRDDLDVADTFVPTDAAVDATQDPFACGTLAPPDPDFKHPVTATIQYVDFSQGLPASGVDVRLCASTDALCTNPRPTITATDAGAGPGSGLDAGAEGGTGWIAPGKDAVVVATVERGFEGFFEVRSQAYAPTLRFTSPPLRNDVNAFDQILLRPAEIAFLADVATGRAGSYDAANRGLIFTLVRDCNIQPLANVRFETTAVDPAQFQFYIVNTAPSVEATKTDGTGRGGFANVKPGLHTFTAYFADTNKRIGSTRAFVRAGTNTTVSILPSP